jgi:NADH-quinone oxidoreductase subunit E
MAACLPALQVCQAANGGWISDEVIAFVAERLEIGSAHVKGVVTFYSLLNTRPPGRHQVWVCRTLSCALRGGESLLAHCEQRLEIREGETTADGRVTLRTAECLASCGSGPVMQVDQQLFEHLSTEDVDRILDRLLHEG